MKKILTLLAFLVTMGTAFGQSTGEIKGKVLDEKGEGIIGGAIQILDANGKPTGRGTVTDFDGNYTLSPLTAGTYNLKFSYVGYKAEERTGVLVQSDHPTQLNINLGLGSVTEVVVTAYKKPLIDAADTKIQQDFTNADIKEQGKLTVEDVASQAAGVTQTDAGGGITINGGRPDEVQYIINGRRVIGNVNIPIGAIQEISVLAGGISAKYGDATSGIVNITLKDAQQSWGGNAEVRTTRGLDPFGTTRADGSIYGPLIKIKDRKDSTNTIKRTLLGLVASVQYQQDVDRSPSAIGAWQVNPTVLNAIKANPLTGTPSTGFVDRADYLTFGDLYKTSTQPNNGENNGNVAGELGFYPTKNISIALGGSYDRDIFNSYVYQYSLLNAEHNPLYKSTDYSLYGRFTQRIEPKKKLSLAAADAKKTGVVIENAQYSVQLDYEHIVRGYDQPQFGNNLFDYGYIGKFQTLSAFEFSQGTKQVGTHILSGNIQNPTATDTAVKYTPGGLNPLGAQFTSEYYQLLGSQNNNGTYTPNPLNRAGFTDNITDIQQAGGLINGERSVPIYQLWYDVGRQYNGYGNDINNQSIRGKVEGSFDIVKVGGDKKNNHQIELGVEYEQRIQRFYALNPLNLWDVGRSLVNTHISADTANPIFSIGGEHYTLANANLNNFQQTDSIIYNQKSNLTQQTYFDRNLRKALGMDPNGAQNIDLDAQDPSKLNIKYFSADELLGYIDAKTGANILSYEGYDYTGNVLNYQPTVRDFFTQKNSDGQFTRPQGAFMPIYAAGYIQDKFYYKDLGFVVGLRVDRYDANQEVLKDKYSLYQIKTAGQVTSLLDANGNTVTVHHPSDIGSNFAVYVDKNGNGQQITGYRDGDNWYDAYGRPSTGKLVAAAGPNGILPDVNIVGVSDSSYAATKSLIKSVGYNPDNSFTKYTAQYLFMPRLQFSFNMTEKAQFFAHYDVLSQRPQSRNDLQVSQYYYFTEYSGVKNNPDLKPIRKTDYEFGFKQQVASFAAVTISAFYQETRNLIQLRKIQYAFPSDYTTYDNIDFRSTKGIRLLFDMRRIKNFKLTANYTLQFVEGTGSDDNSQFYLVSANLPNFRTVYPVSTDTRHQIKFTVDYRFEGGKNYNGPLINNKQILADFGINLGMNLRSGTPTRQTATVSDDASLSSTVGRQATTSLDARLPWYTRFDLRINKDFVFKLHKKSKAKESKEGKEIGISVYCYIQNLLNTQNVLNIYPYTLNANDDGYLKSSVGLANIAQTTNPQSYKDLYRAAVNNPTNYSYPRRIYLGLNVNF